MERHPTLSPPQEDIYCAHSEQLVWADWGEEQTLYNRATGETHILSLFPVEILKSLAEQPADIPTLARRLAAVGGVECSPSWVEATAKSLLMLHNLDLVEQLNEHYSCSP